MKMCGIGEEKRSLKLIAQTMANNIKNMKEKRENENMKYEEMAYEKNDI